MTGVPGPGSYHDGTSEIAGRKTVSKFRSSTLGSSLTSKSKRFDLFNRTFILIQPRHHHLGSITKGLAILSWERILVPRLEQKLDLPLLTKLPKALSLQGLESTGNSLSSATMVKFEEILG